MRNSGIELLSVESVRDQLAVVIPVHFASHVPEGQIREILAALLGEADLFCRLEHLLAVVDRGTVAEQVLRGFRGIRVLTLERNRGKAGAVAAGLAELLSTSDAPYFATRDCDGDHAQEDLTRLVSLAVHLERRTHCPLIGIMGARPSLEKPMGWLRDQWERLTNAVLVDLCRFLLARRGRVLDTRFWGGTEPDVQSGYRVYSRGAAERVRNVLNALPDEEDVLTFACEFIPFADLALAGGALGQVRRLTLVEQPVTSYGGVDLGRVYGRLLAYVAELFDVPRPVVRQLFDNHLPAVSIFFSDARSELLRARRLIDPEAPAPEGAPFL